MRSLAFEQAVPLGMRGKIFLRRHERIECVTKALVLNAAAQIFWNHMRFAVRAVARLPNRVKTAIPIRRTILKGGLLAHVEVRNAQRAPARNVRGPRRPPTHAALLLKKMINCVKRPARTSTGEQQSPVL